MYKAPNSPKTLYSRLLYPFVLHNHVPGSGGEIASHPFRNSASESGIKRQKLKFNNLYTYFQWKIRGYLWPGINLWISIKKSR